MKQRHIAALIIGCMALVAAAKPATKPTATKPTTTKPAMGPDTSMAKDQYHFPAPPSPEWSATNADPSADSIAFINTAHDGMMQLVLLAKDANVDPNIAGNVAVAILKQLKQSHAEKKDEMVLPPKIEKDHRFAIVIHEKYKVGVVVADQLHVYKSVGPRVLMLTVNSVAKDPAKNAEILKEAEEMLDSAKFNRKAFKK